MKTAELTGDALNWAVAVCEDVYCFDGTYTPSTNWAQGGAIIERENISVMFSFELQTWVSAIGELWVPEEGGIHGTTPLIAAMRCYVASKMGDNIEIPEEL